MIHAHSELALAAIFTCAKEPDSCTVALFQAMSGFDDVPAQGCPFCRSDFHGNFRVKTPRP